MKRRLTIEIGLSDDELARIVPSGSVHVEIIGYNGVVSEEASIVSVTDAPGMQYEFYDSPGEPIIRYPGELYD